MEEKKLFELVKEDLRKIEQELINEVSERNEFLHDPAMHLLKAGGKRLRPAFALLAAKLGDYDFEKVKPLAVALELIHMATLVHDDVVDNSMLRRGLPTVKANWGNKMSIHIGDRIFAKSLLLIDACKNNYVAKVLAEVSVKMTAGEIQQLNGAKNISTSIKEYLIKIKRKTALLLSASCELGGIMANVSPRVVYALKQYGLYVGMAFQIVDDILDFTADEKVLGKPVGSDLRQGLITLPVLLALKRDKKHELWRELQNLPQNNANIEQIIKEIKNLGGISEAYAWAKNYIEKAISAFDLVPKSPVKDTFLEIAQFIVQRNY
ncbi:heptaprenyl diphosphate synthase component II [Carboxydothermus islandicus]|uniref:Heptaprenyl diphosphate synthase component II n=1 Tax=Carboxydothermus islandicus TaxID=661089 RepID=A0A1L8D2P7_9THEO|nr:heptaprenyl diphosphate synthase component II [Carboxydothermus islandicus]